MTVLRLSFLGEPVVTLDGAAVRLKPRKALALLVYLAVTARRHSRDALAELLFPTLSRDRARAGIRQCLSVVRRSLGDDFLRSDGDSVWLEPGGFWLDVREIERADASREALEHKEQLYRGEFLSGFFLKDARGFDSWQRSVEQSCRKERASVLKRLSEICFSARETDEAINHADRWLELDPTDEAAHRMLMQSYALAGKRAEALRQYARCREVLQAELGAVPDELTEQLRLRIAQGEDFSSGAAPVAFSPPPNNLRFAQTVFVGRETELKEVQDAINRDGVRLLTITGAAGSGKTRLAIEAARRMLDDYPNGTFFVDLAPLSEPSHVLGAVGNALGVQELPRGVSSRFDRVSEFLRPMKVLLVLDNFEHLREAGGDVSRLLAHCPRLTVIATSREALKLQAENEYLLSPLHLPREGSRLEDLRVNEAVRLFVDRARASRHGFALSEENAGAVSRICVRLDGLPLAIELAAGRTRFLPPDTLLAMLERGGSSMLSGGSQDMPPRHRTLWSAIEWSYEMLAPSEKVLLARLSVFRGGFTLEGAEAVCSEAQGESILPDLESLTEKNFVSLAGPGGEPWYIILVTIREFAQRRLEERGEAETMSSRHARCYLEMAEKAEVEIGRRSSVQIVMRLEREYSNIRAAVEWSTTHSVEIALRILAALERFFDPQGHGRDACEWMQAALSNAAATPGLDRWRARALTAFSNFILSPMHAAHSSALARESVVLWRKVEDRRGLGRALLLLGLSLAYGGTTPDEVLAPLDESASLQRATADLEGLSHTMFWQAYFTYLKGDITRATALLREDRELSLRVEDISRHAGCAGLSALFATDAGEYESARSFAAEGVTLFRNTADPYGLFYLLCSTGGIAFLEGDFAAARSAFTEACERGYYYDDYTVPIGNVCIGSVALREGRLPECRAAFREGIERLRGAEYPWARQCRSACMAGIAATLEQAGRAPEAARILGAVESVLRAQHLRLAWGHDFSTTPTLIKSEYDRITSIVRTALGDGAEPSFEAGRRLSLDAAAALALSDAAAQ